MARPKSDGPHRSLVLWTQYLLTVVGAVLATVLLIVGDGPTKTLAAIMFWRTAKSLSTLSTR